MKHTITPRNLAIYAGAFAIAGGIFGTAIGGVIEHAKIEDSFNNAADEIQNRTMHVSVDTLYTKDGKIGDIRRDTTYVVTKKDFEQLSPKFK